MYCTKKRRSTPRFWNGEKKIKNQGYRIAQTVVMQSHGMQPNFVHWQIQYNKIEQQCQINFSTMN